MHLRKTRKAKAAASEFVRRVISGKDVSPDRRAPTVTTSKTSKASGSKPTAAKATNARGKSPSRGRARSPRPGSRAVPSGSTRSASRSPSSAPEHKTKTNVQKVKTEAVAKSPARRGRPPKNPHPESLSTQVTSKATKGHLSKPSAKQTESEKPKKVASDKSKKGQTEKFKLAEPIKPNGPILEAVKDKENSCKSNPSSSVTKIVPSVKGKSTDGLSTKGSATAKLLSKLSKEESESEKKTCETRMVSECAANVDKPTASHSGTLSESPRKPVQIITPHIVFVDRNSQNVLPDSPTHLQTPGMYVERIWGSPQGFKSGTPIKISPTAKLIPVSSFSNINTTGKNVYTISIPGSSLAKSVGQGSTQFIVSAQPIGSTNASPIKVMATTSGSNPRQVTLDLAELAKSVTSMIPQGNTPEQCKEVPIVEPFTQSAATPIINKSPKFLLSKKGSKKEPVSEGKIKKRRQSKIPAWDVPSAVFKTLFDQPQPKFVRKDEEIKYPESANMEQSDYFRIMGIINKADIKKNDGTEHRNHRHAGGKLRRVCKPKISPEMVYRRFSLARGCIMHDVFVDSDDENNDDSNSPRVISDKSSIIKTDHSKKGSLSPKMHDSYKQHCNKIPVITIEKVAKDGSNSEGEKSPVKSGAINSLKENHLQAGTVRHDLESGEGCSSGSARRKGLNPSRKPATHSPKQKAKLGGVKKHLDANKVGTKLVKSKSFDVVKKSNPKPSTMAKSKSFERFSGVTKVEASKNKAVLPKVEQPEEEEDGARRSARNRGSKRKQWWHLLRANPDEFEEDKEWNKEVAVQEEKRKARLERARERAEGGESPVEQDDEPAPKKEPVKVPKKKAKVKKEPDCAGDGVDPKSYTDLYETKLKKKKKRSTDWALAKKVLEEAQAMAKAKEDGEVGPAGKAMKSPSKGAKKDSGIKRKPGESLDGDTFMKKIKAEPLSASDSDDDLGEKQGGRLKKKRSISGAELDEPIDEKPEIITNLIILGENGEPLHANSNMNLYDQLQSLLEGKDCDNPAQTGVLELTAPPDSPQSFIEILAREQEQKKQRPQSPFGMLPIIRSDVLYKTKEAECIAPHICSVCWVNDHMYCRNMKRIARDLPLCGGCIHYVPCGHYRQKMSPSTMDRKQMQRRVRHSVYTTIDHGEGGEKTVVPLGSACGSSSFTSTAARMINFSGSDAESDRSRSSHDDRLLCDEILTESDSEPSSPEAPTPPGTELLKAEIRARGSQIKRALGFKSLPQTISPLKRKLQWSSPQKLLGHSSDDSANQEDEDDSADVIVSEYALEETIYFGKETADVDYGVPLSDKFLVQRLVTNESWLTGTSIFMPNTESDASNDSHDILPEQTPTSRSGTTTEHIYEESVFGENSQDSTETSLSQISTHVESDDSDADHLIGEPQVSWREEKRRRKKRGSADVIHVKSLGLDDGTDLSFEGLKNKWQKGEDGTQVLTFTTKEIRERKPELLAYIKRAGLLGVISDKLCLEKSSIKKLYKENETSMRQSQDKLEQHRCLMAAVLTEILAVKEQLRDLQTALVDEECVCAKLRKESKDINTQCSMAEEKVCVLKKIITQAQENGLMPQTMTEQSDISSGDSEQDVSAETQVEVSTDALVASARGEHQMPEVENIEMVIDTETAMETTMMPVGGQTPEVGSQTLEVKSDSIGMCHEPMSVDLAEPLQSVGTKNGHGGVHALYDTEVTMAPEGTRVPGCTAVVSAAPILHAGVGPINEHVEDMPQARQELGRGEDGQVVSVSIEGGRSVMLELPKDLLQCESNADTDLTALGEAGGGILGPEEILHAAENPLHQMEGYLGEVLVGQTAGTADTVPQEMIHIMQADGHVVVQGQSACNVQAAQPHVPTTQLSQSLQHELPSTTQQRVVTEPAQIHHQEGMLLQVSDCARNLYTHAQMGLQHQTPVENVTNLKPVGAEIPIQSESTVQLDPGVVASPDLTLAQPVLEGSLKQAATDFDNIIMRPGDLGDVILQTNDMGTLSLHPSDVGNHIVQQSDLPMMVDSAGLNTYLTTQLVDDSGLFVQQDVRDNYIIHQQGAAVHAQHSNQPIIIQTTESSRGLFVPSTSTVHHQPANVSMVQQPNNPQSIIIQQEGTVSQEMIMQQQHLPQNLILQADSGLLGAASTMFVPDEQQQPLVEPQHQPLVEQQGPLLTQQGPLLTQQGQDIVLQNVDFLHGQVGQVQTITINGQAYQVIIQEPEQV